MILRTSSSFTNTLRLHRENRNTTCKQNGGLDKRNVMHVKTQHRFVN